MNRRKLKIPGAVTALAATVALAGLAAPVQAQGINVTVDGDVVAFAGQRPVERFGTILVPLRGVFEKLGATVAYDGGSKTILAVKGQTTVSLRLGDAAAQVNGETRRLLLPAQAVNGTTLVPLRFVSEALGAQVQWRGASRTVVISTDGTAVADRPEENAPPANPSGRVEVTSLTHNGGEALRGGEILTVTLQGTPGGNATFSIPGIEAARNITMTETAPGTYVGRFTVPGGSNVKGASLLAALRVRGASSPVIQSGQPLTVDAVGPTLANLSPAPGAALPPGKPLIYGTYSDAGTGVNAEATRLLVNGRDVTERATITEAFFSYRPEADLPVGKNTATIIARDAAGNETRKDIGFTLSTGAALIKSISFSPAAKTLEPGDVLTVRVEAAPGGTARFGVGGAVTNRPMQETGAGVYVGTYTVKKGDSLAEAPISVAFTSSSGRTVTQTASDALTIAAGAPDQPVIESPQADQKVGDTVTLRGRAAPNSTVRYSLKYQGTLLVIPAGGTVADGEVKADAQGRWSIPDVRLSAPLGVSRLSYTLAVAAVGAAGELSEATTVTFQR